MSWSPLCSHLLDPPSLIAILLTISSQFSSIYIYIFHKTEIQTIILRCLNGSESQLFSNAKQEVTTRQWLSHIFIVVSLIKTYPWKNWKISAYCINRETNTVELRRKFLSEPRRDVKQKKGKSCSIHHMNHALILVWELLSHGGTPQVLPNP
jgi:hypothetical protein